jgi:hypothetical protein
MAVGTKLSQIVSPPLPIGSSTDQFVGVQGGATDVLYNAGDIGSSNNPFFSTQGSTDPLHNYPTFPQTLYAQSINRTLQVYEGALPGGARSVWITSYQHDTALPYPTVSPLRWTVPVYVAAQPLVNDSHGNPAIWQDWQRYFHIVHGPHAGVLLHRVSTNPDSITHWQDDASVGTDITYPAPIVANDNKTYLLARTTGLAQLSYYVGTQSSGSTTWGALNPVINWDFSQRVYWGGTVFLTATNKVHFIATRADSPDNWRRDVYYCVLNISTGALENWDGSHSIAAGSLPANQAAMDANYKIVSQPTPTGSGTVLTLYIDASGNKHVLFSDGPGLAGSFGVPQTVYYLANFGSGWTTPISIGTTPSFSFYWTLTGSADGGIDAYGPTTTSNIVKMHRTPGAFGTWGPQQVILADPDTAVFLLPGGGCSPEFPGTFNVNSNYRIAFCEFNNNAEGDAEPYNGRDKVWAYGDSGFLSAPNFESTSQSGLAPPFSGDPNQFLNGQGQYSAPVASGGRLPLLSATTFYVRTDGNNANNGLSDSPAGAFLTFQAAYTNVVSKYDFAGQTVTIKAGSEAGIKTFAGMSINQQWVGGGSLTITGNGANTIMNNGPDAFGDAIGIFCVLPGTLFIGSITLTSSTDICIYHAGYGLLKLQAGVIFGTASAAHIHAFGTGAEIDINANYSITGGATQHLFAAFGGFICDNITVGTACNVTLTGTPAFNAFATAEGAQIQIGLTTYSGAATGRRFDVQSGGLILVPLALSFTFFPGNADGVIFDGWYGDFNGINVFTSATEGSFAVTKGFDVVSWPGANIGWTGSSDTTVPNVTAFETGWARDTAYQIGQRSGTHAQSYYLYNTFTDSSNYELSLWDWNASGGILSFGTTQAGTGVARPMRTVVGGKVVAKWGTTPNLTVNDKAYAGDQISIAGSPSGFQVINDGNISWNTSFLSASTSAFGPANVFAKTASATPTVNSIVSNNDYLFFGQYKGSDNSAFRDAAYMYVRVDGVPADGTSMPGRFEFGTSPSGTFAPALSYEIDNTGACYFPRVGTTAAGSANAQLNNASTPANSLLRFTSSLRYKTDVCDVPDARLNALAALRPIEFRSLCPVDDPDKRLVGYAAEQVATIDPTLVHWGYADDDYYQVEEIAPNGARILKDCLKQDAQIKPDGVMYERVLLLKMAAMERKIEELERKLKEKESNIPAE